MANPIGNPTDPNEGFLINKSLFVNNNGGLQQVSRSFIEVISTGFNDIRVGSSDADDCNLGNGADTAQGGADRFWFLAVDSSASAHERIMDFSLGSDKMVQGLVDADAARPACRPRPTWARRPLPAAVWAARTVK